jgi:hypothetical protein
MKGERNGMCMRRQGEGYLGQEVRVVQGGHRPRMAAGPAPVLLRELFVSGEGPSDTVGVRYWTPTVAGFRLHHMAKES